MAAFNCRECGNSLESEHRFCPVCGAAHEPMDKETEGGIEAFEEGEYEKALKLFKSVARKNPFSAFALRDVAHAAFHLKDFNTAMEYYEKALKIQPNQLDSHFNLGLIHMNRGHVSDAMFTFMET